MKDYDGIKKMICEVLAVYPGNVEITQEQIDAFDQLAKELDYSETVVLKHLYRKHNFGMVARILDVPISYVRKKYKRAIRRLKAPIKYYKILMGLEKYEAWKDTVVGSTSIKVCNLTTRTMNVLLKNNIRTTEELDAFIGDVPERFAYIEGLGKFGMSELLYYYRNESLK